MPSAPMRSYNTEKFAKKLRSQLGERFVVVARPESPYLISPPDLLIGGEGLLTAAFVPAKRRGKTNASPVTCEACGDAAGTL